MHGRWTRDPRRSGEASEAPSPRFKAARVSRLGVHLCAIVRKRTKTRLRQERVLVRTYTKRRRTSSSCPPFANAKLRHDFSLPYSSAPKNLASSFAPAEPFSSTPT